MNDKQEITCHNDAPRFLDTPIEWKERHDERYASISTHCSYCGSLHFEDIRKILSKGGKLGGSDWKYGYPHKFYVYHGNGKMDKFYTEHLNDLQEPEFTEFATLLKQATDIQFSRDAEGRLMYSAPYAGYQR